MRTVERNRNGEFVGIRNVPRCNERRSDHAKTVARPESHRRPIYARMRYAEIGHERVARDIVERALGADARGSAPDHDAKRCA